MLFVAFHFVMYYAVTNRKACGKDGVVIMENQKIEKIVEFFLVTILLITSMIGGGYFGMASSVATILMLVFLIIYFLKMKVIKIAKNYTFIAIVCLTIFYFLSVFWAVDKGMTVVGGIKFLPLFLFFVLLCQIGERRENIISVLPVIGTVMTIFSFVMMQFAVFEKIVTVAGRLSGFFQYPNTYALFMLVCMIIVMYRLDLRQMDWLDMVHIVVSVFGILMSGSRIVFVLTGGIIAYFIFAKKELRKIAFGVLGVFAIIMAGVAISGMGKDIFSRFLHISFQSSTLLGRVLYAQDAVPLIIRNPLGLGYYGYYFMQQEMQTGVYSVVNVHNEFLQIMLDVGIIPAIVFYGAMIKSIFTVQGRNRLVLMVLMLHSFLDYDFQFLFMCFVLLLFLDVANVKELKVPVFSRAVCSVAVFGIAVLAICTGLSEGFYMLGDTEKALKCYSGNTMAKIIELSQADSVEEMEEKADRLLESNEHMSIAYSAKAQVAFAKGDTEEYIKNQLKAIHLAPYQYEEYERYLEILAYCVSKYLDGGEVESAKICVKRAEAIPDMLEEVKNRTSWLGWQINDMPTVTLSHENLELIKEMRMSVGE